MYSYIASYNHSRTISQKPCECYSHYICSCRKYVSSKNPPYSRSSEQFLRANIFHVVLAYDKLWLMFYGSRTAAATTEHHNPFLFPSADCVIFIVLYILPDIFHSCV